MSDVGPDTQRRAKSGGLLAKLHKYAYFSTFIYACIIALLATPYIQRQ